MSSIHVQPLFDTASARQKEAERQQLEADIECFRKAGGKVQVLGNSPIDRSTITRRQVVEGGIDQRTSRKGRKA